MTSPSASFAMSPILRWTVLSTFFVVACSSSEDLEVAGIDTRASDGGDAGDARAPDGSSDDRDASSDGGDIPEPPPYDFAVACAKEPCVTRIAARGGSHVCAILRDGSLRCWGSNGAGQLGTGTDDGGLSSGFESTPRRVVGITNATFLTAAGQGTVGTTCVVSGPGDVACFGSDAWGQLGQGTADSMGASSLPMTVPGVRAKSVSLANRFVLAIGTDDRVWSWGTNDTFQLARPAPDLDAGLPDGSLPARATLLTNPIRACAGTSANGFAIAESGELLSWGGSTTEQLGRASSTIVDPHPSAVPLADVVGIAAGDAHACALSRGRVDCWGDNDRGQLGTGNRAAERLPKTTLLPAGVYPMAVAAGGDNTCIIAAAGDLYCWGSNASGQLGVAPGEAKSRPSRIEGLAEQVVGVAVMDEAICVLLRSGSVLCRGDNLFGQLGRGARDIDFHVEAAPAIFE